MDRDLISYAQEVINDHIIKSKEISEINGPDRFYYYNIKVLMLDRALPAIGLLGLFTIVWLSVRICTPCCKKKPRYRKFLNIVEWNMILSVFYVFFPPIYFSLILQTSHLKFDESYETLSAILSIVLLTLGGVVTLIFLVRFLKV